MVEEALRKLRLLCGALSGLSTLLPACAMPLSLPRMLPRLWLPPRDSSLSNWSSLQFR